MAMLIDIENQQPCVIGVNAKGELGLGDREQRKTFCVLNELREKILARGLEVPVVKPIEKKKEEEEDDDDEEDDDEDDDDDDEE